MLAKQASLCSDLRQKEKGLGSGFMMSTGVGPEMTQLHGLLAAPWGVLMRDFHSGEVGMLDLALLLERTSGVGMRQTGL